MSEGKFLVSSDALKRWLNNQFFLNNQTDFVFVFSGYTLSIKDCSDGPLHLDIHRGTGKEIEIKVPFETVARLIKFLNMIPDQPITLLFTENGRIYIKEAIL